MSPDYHKATAAGAKKSRVSGIKEVFIIHREAPIPLILDSDSPPGGPGRSTV